MADLDSLLSEADYVSLHMPLTPETEGLIGKSQLERMKPEAFLINTSRGKTVDPKALYDALSVGTIAGAAIDVADPEPIPMDDLLLTLPNLGDHAPHRQRKLSHLQSHGQHGRSQHHRGLNRPADAFVHQPRGARTPPGIVHR